MVQMNIEVLLFLIWPRTEHQIYSGWVTCCLYTCLDVFMTHLSQLILEQIQLF